ncbi:hypothetical protein GGI43DRAFT_387873 [Trichoderma evansii]
MVRENPDEFSVMIRYWNKHDTDSMMYNHEDWELAFIVVDEASRLTETMTALTFSHFLQTRTIFIGDTKQFSPKAVVKEDREYHALYVKQGVRSLLQRMEIAG